MEGFSALITQADQLGKVSKALLQSVKGEVTLNNIKRTIWNLCFSLSSKGLSTISVSQKLFIFFINNVQMFINILVDNFPFSCGFRSWAFCLLRWSICGCTSALGWLLLWDRNYIAAVTVSGEMCVFAHNCLFFPLLHNWPFVCV